MRHIRAVQMQMQKLQTTDGQRSTLRGPALTVSAVEDGVWACGHWTLGYGRRTTGGALAFARDAYVTAGLMYGHPAISVGVMVCAGCTARSVSPVRHVTVMR